MTSLHFFTVMPSPYQRQTFRALNASDRLSATVDYLADTAGDRLWARETLDPYEKILPGMQLLRGGASGRVNFAVLRRLRGLEADLVVLSDYSSPSIQFAAYYLTAIRRPWVYWGEAPGVNPRGPVGLWLRRRLQSPLRHATALAAIGTVAERAYSDLIPNVPVFNIPYFCDIEPFRYAAADRVPAPACRVRLLFSGQLIHRKGIDLLIEAFRRALVEAPDLELHILGDGPLRLKVERAVRDCKGRVTLIGHQAPAELPRLFAGADIFVLPSRHDGWGVVINEALGSGLPIIATDRVGAARDLIAHGVNGLITPSEDVESLSNAFVQLALDPKRRAAMAAASRARATVWGLDECVRRWESMCDALVGASGAGQFDHGRVFS